MITKVFCSGFKLFQQIPEVYDQSLDNYCSLLNDLPNIKLVTFSWSACYILLENGDLYANGFIDGELMKFKKIITPAQSFIKHISCCGKYEVCVTNDGKCWKRLNDSWEDITNNLNTPVSLNNSFKVIDVAANDTQFVCLSNAGIAFNFPSALQMDSIYKVEKVACGSEHSICLTTVGSVFSWGCGSRGQLGNDELDVSEIPKLVTKLDGLRVIDIAAGGWHSAVVTEAGDVYAWGWNCFGQLGTGSNDVCGQKEPSEAMLSSPFCVTWPTNVDPSVKSVSCGSRHTMAVFEDGSLWGCGWNRYGQVNPTSKEKVIYEMTAVPVLACVTEVKNVHCAAWNTAIMCNCA